MTLRIYAAMFRKEFRELLPVAITLLALSVLGISKLVIFEAPDLHTWSEVSLLLGAGEGSASVVYMIFGLIVGFRLFPRERSSGTLMFLWSLPISRWHIYVTKCVCAWLILVACTCLDLSFGYALHLFDPSSVTRGQFSWALLLWELMLGSGVFAIAIGYGVLASYFRAMGLLVAIALVIFSAMAEQIWPELVPVGINKLLAPEFKGEEIRIATQAWWVHGSISFVCAILGGVLWIYHSDARANPTFVRIMRVFRGGTIAIVACAALVLVIGYDLTEPLGNVEPMAQEPRESLSSERFRFSHSPTQHEQLLTFIDEADALFDATQSLLGTAFDELVAVNLTATSAGHLGRATWKTLEIQPKVLDDPDLLAHVLVHETAHVLAGQASQRRLGLHGEKAMFFSEGLAEWVAFEVVSRPQDRLAQRMLAAAAWYRHDVSFSDMVSGSTFSSRFDEFLVYALGETWVSALATTCGIAAPGDVLRAIGRPDAPQRLTATAFWVDALGAIGCDLASVNGRFELLLSDHRDAADTIPGVVGGATTTGKEILFKFRLKGETDDEAHRIIVRIRSDARSPIRHYRRQSMRLRHGELGQLPFPRSSVGEQYQYQFGVEFMSGKAVLFTPWIQQG